MRVASRLVTGCDFSAAVIGISTPCPSYLVLAPTLAIKAAPMTAMTLPNVTAGINSENMTPAFVPNPCA